jgi:hypothetical protein
MSRHAWSLPFTLSYLILAGSLSVNIPASAERVKDNPYTSYYRSQTVEVSSPVQARRSFRTDGCGRLTSGKRRAAEDLADRIEERIVDRVKGYSIAVAKDCLLAAQVSGGIAITAADNNGVPEMMTDMHRSAMGSVAKLVTAIAIVQELEAQAIDPDSSIASYLGLFWDLDDFNYNADLSWANLLNQTSGIDSGNTTDQLAYGELGEFLAEADDSGVFKYDNANAGILRVLLWGLVHGSAPNGNSNQIEAITAQYFQSHVRAAIFDPISVIDAQCGAGATAPHAQQYMTVNASTGWLPTISEAREWCGPGGWFLSSVELLNLAVHVAHTDRFMSFAMRDRMEADRFGWDTPTDSWPKILQDKEHIRFKAGELMGRSCVMDFMNGTEVSVVVNSADISGPALCAELADAYYDPGVWLQW